MRLRGAHRLLGGALALGLGVLVAADSGAQTPEIQMSVTGKASGSASSMKVPEEFHAALTEEDFNEDLSGEKHRDPFQSYMTPSTGPLSKKATPDTAAMLAVSLVIASSVLRAASSADCIASMALASASCSCFSASCRCRSASARCSCASALCLSASCRWRSASARCC